MSSGNPFDLDGDIDDDDITEWITLTDKVNGYGSTFLRGDTDGLGNLPGTPQTFDITDFKIFLKVLPVMVQLESPAILMATRT